MIYLNETPVEFITFPNNEKRLDMPKDILRDEILLCGDTKPTHPFLSCFYWMTR